MYSTPRRLFADKVKSEPGPTVGYFWHMRKDMTKPYGLAYKENAFDDEHYLSVMNSKNCEFLTRPKTTFSELAETVNRNLDYVTGHQESIKVFDRFLNKMKPYQESFAIIDKFNDKEGNVQEALLKVSHFMALPNRFDDQFIPEAMKFSSSLFLLCHNLRMAQVVLRHPETVIKNLHPQAAFSAFKKEPTPDNYMKDVSIAFGALNIQTNDGVAAGPKVSLLDIPDDDEIFDDMEASAPPPPPPPAGTPLLAAKPPLPLPASPATAPVAPEQKKKKKIKRTSVIEDSEEESNVAEYEEDKPKKKKKIKRRT